jgi:hypothetical protein
VTGLQLVKMGGGVVSEVTGGYSSICWTSLGTKRPQNVVRKNQGKNRRRDAVMTNQA